MTATVHRLRAGAGPITSPRYSVVGRCSAKHAVSHVGILADARDLKLVQMGRQLAVAAFHMANPSDKLEMPGTMQVNAVGWLHDMTPDEQASIEDWLNELKTIANTIEYWACPSRVLRKDPSTGRDIAVKFSCAGFVQHCFAEAVLVELVVCDEELPEVDVDVLKEAWPFVVRQQHRGQAEQLLGGGHGPWKVLLPGYLFHALKLERAALPYRPAAADPCFPPDLPAKAPPQAG